MLEPTIKTYNEIVARVFSDYSLLLIRHISNNFDFASEWVYDNRWELFDMPVDDELQFDESHIEDIQDMAYRYLGDKNL